MTVAASARFEYRLRPEAKRKIEQAADLVHESASDFARTAAEQRAEQILAEHARLTTVVSSDYFEELLAALDEPALPNAALANAARLARNTVKHR